MSAILLRPQWASCQIRKIAGYACARNAGNVFPVTDFKGKQLVCDPGMHSGTCVTHVPWCMSGSLTRGGGENVPGIPGACATHNFTHLARGPCAKLFCRKKSRLLVVKVEHVDPTQVTWIQGKIMLPKQTVYITPIKRTSRIIHQ